MVMMVLSTRDHKTFAHAWRTARAGLHPSTRRRMGLRGRSSLMRELILWGFEQASSDPEAFLRYVRETRDPLIGRTDGRHDLGSERREAMLASWSQAFGTVDGGSRRSRAKS